jgi:hypothetical protein
MPDPTQKPPPTPEEAWAAYEKFLKEDLAEFVGWMEEHLATLRRLTGQADEHLATLKELPAPAPPKKRKRSP